jgi:hypothetical protein
VKRPVEVQGLREELSYPAKLIRGKTVAIVGNGPSMLEGHHGKAIDAHDIVIRMNAGAPGKHDGVALGYRTTVLTAGTKGVMDVSLHELGVPPAQIWWMKRTRMGWSDLEQVVKRDGPEVPAIWIFPGVWHTEIHSQCLKASGGLAIAYAVGHHLRAGYVTLYGFDLWAAGDSWWKERHPDAVIRMKLPHSGQREGVTLEALGYKRQEDGTWNKVE